MASKDLVFRFIGVDSGAGREFDRMAGKSASLERTVGKLGVAFTGAAVAIGVESVRAAAKFQSAMELIHTQAHRSQKTVEQMSKAALAMSGSVATGPNELAKAMYHLASTGMSVPRMLQATKIAAEGAKMGGADLEATTNALTAAMLSGMKGAGNMSKAMGALNAIVGAGDMRMQDLADAFGTGMLRTVRGFGVTLNDVGAALATFGDHQIRGADAATQLRMSVLFLAKPAASAKDALKALGLTSHTLADDMGKRGLGFALEDLHKRLVKAGDTGSKMGQVLLDLFGHKAGVGLSILEGDLGRFEQKQKDVQAGSKNFASDWTAYTQTFGYSWDRARAAFESMTIQLGQKLLPVATKAMNWIGTTGVKDLDKFGGWVARNKKPIEDIGIALAGIATLKFATGKISDLQKAVGVLTGGRLGGATGQMIGRGSPTNPMYVVVMDKGAPGLPGKPTGLPGTLKRAAKWVPVVGTIAAAAEGANLITQHGNSSSQQRMIAVAGQPGGVPALQQEKANLSAMLTAAGGLDPMTAKVLRMAIGQIDAALKSAGAAASPTAAKVGVTVGDALNRGVDRKIRSQLAGVASRDARVAVAQIAKNAAQAAADGGDYIGAMLAEGVARGIEGHKAHALAAAGDLTAQAVGQMQRAGLIKSPSEKTTYLGRMLAAGLERGLHMGAKGVSDAARQLMGTVLGNFQASASLGNLGSQPDSLGATGGGITAAGITGFLHGQAVLDRGYVRNLALLRKKGVSSYLVQQIAQMEPTQGSQYAAALTHATAGQIRAINRDEAAVARYGHQAGGIVTLSQNSINQLVHAVSRIHITTDSGRLSHHSAKKIRARA